jgi:hypothetical protein
MGDDSRDPGSRLQRRQGRAKSSTPAHAPPARPGRGQRRSGWSTPRPCRDGFALHDYVINDSLAGLVLGPLPVGAWAFLGLTTVVATGTLPFASAMSAMTSEVGGCFGTKLPLTSSN